MCVTKTNILKMQPEGVQNIKKVVFTTKNMAVQNEITFLLTDSHNWDPFTDLPTSIREMERNFQRMERDMEHLWNRMGFPRFLPTFPRRIPLQTSGNKHICNFLVLGSF